MGETVASALSRSNGKFEQSLAFGRMAETDIAKYLIRARGNIVQPAYDVEYHTGKGPRVFGRNAEWVAPDLYVWTPDGKQLWIEAKHKSVFTWYRKSKHWTTGIDRRHWCDYQRVARATRTETWLLFLHRNSQPDAKDRQHDGCPERCPTGLFGQEISKLEKSKSHESDRWGKTGMVYWRHEALIEIATLEEVLKYSQ